MMGARLEFSESHDMGFQSLRRCGSWRRGELGELALQLQISAVGCQAQPTAEVTATWYAA